MTEVQAKALGLGCKQVLRDLKALFPSRDGFGSPVVEVKKGTPDKDEKAVGPGQIIKIFVSKTKNEGMIGNGSHVSLGFLRGECGCGTPVVPTGEMERGHLQRPRDDWEACLLFKGHL